MLRRRWQRSSRNALRDARHRSTGPLQSGSIVANRASFAPPVWRRGPKNMNGLSGSRNCPALDSTAARVKIATGCWMPSTFSAETTLFGIGITFEGNHPEALRRALSVFPQEYPEGRSNGQRIHVALVEHEGDVPAVDFSQVNGRRLEAVERGITVKADGERGSGSCIFQPASVSTEPFTNAI